MSRDYYEVIGVSKDASDEEIKKEYRKKAKQYHPDRNVGDKIAEEAFKEVQNAYEILGNPIKRQQYDQMGQIPVGGSSFPGSDFFDQFFNFKREPDGQGKHIEVEVVLEFIEAANGCKKSLDIDRRHNCSSCNGTGAKDGQSMKECVVCDGKGRVFQRFGNAGGFMRVETVCSSCRGSGKVISVFCSDCHARGFVTKNVTIEIDIPAGIDDGMKVCLRGQGDIGTNGFGNLYCRVKVLPHPLFYRSGKNVQITVPITYTQAIFGAKIDVPFPYGKCDFVLPENTKTGTTFRLEKLGLPDLSGGGKGDLFVRVEIDIPKERSSEYNDILNKLREFENIEVSPAIKEYHEKDNFCSL
jgi:molecular chaperone DnaJ